MYIGDKFKHNEEVYYLGDGYDKYFAIAKNLTDLYHLEPGEYIKKDENGMVNKIGMIKSNQEVEFISSSIVNFRKFNKMKESKYFKG